MKLVVLVNNYRVQKMNLSNRWMISYDFFSGCIAPLINWATPIQIRIPPLYGKATWPDTFYFKIELDMLLQKSGGGGLNEQLLFNSLLLADS